MIARSAPPLTIGVLRVGTIVAYGACYYAFGVRSLARREFDCTRHLPHELVDTRHLGMLMGAQQAVFGIGGAAGPDPRRCPDRHHRQLRAALVTAAACFTAEGAILLRSHR